jgi:predicted nucleic acid-binding protein
MAAGKRRKEIEAWFARLERWAGPRLLAPTEAVMREWGRLCANNECKGRRLPVLDSLIAATAIAHGLTLVTRNVGDYPEEVALLNPWED